MKTQILNNFLSPCPTSNKFYFIKFQNECKHTNFVGTLFTDIQTQILISYVVVNLIIRDYYAKRSVSVQGKSFHRIVTLEPTLKLPRHYNDANHICTICLLSEVISIILGEINGQPSSSPKKQGQIQDFSWGRAKT